MDRTLDGFLRKLFNPRYHSVFVAITGPNQAGKSVMALWMQNRSYELSLFRWIGTNIPNLKATIPIDFIEDLETLKERCEALGANGTNRYLFVGDEMGIWAPKDQHWLNVDLIVELQEVRKYGLSFIGCGIDRIDPSILSPAFFMGKIEKRSKAHPDKAIYYNWEHFPKIKAYRISNIPNFTIDGFNTYKKAKFYMKKKNPTQRDYEPDFVTLYRNYLNEGKSWKALGIHPQKGKREKEKLLDFLWEKYESSPINNIEPPSITGSQVPS